MSAAKKSSALIVIDVQQSFEHRPFWSTADLPVFQEKLLQLIAGCEQAGIPVVHIFHVSPSGPFAKDSGWVKAMDWLPSNPSVSFEKKVHNALLESGLHEWLQARDIQHLIISGIRTEQCCETTARVASDMGYTVDFVSEATLTFDMTHANGNVHSAAALKERTELVLAGRFARICTVEEALN